MALEVLLCSVNTCCHVFLRNWLKIQFFGYTLSVNYGGNYELGLLTIQPMCICCTSFLKFENQVMRNGQNWRRSTVLYILDQPKLASHSNENKLNEYIFPKIFKEKSK